MKEDEKMSMPNEPYIEIKKKKKRKEMIDKRYAHCTYPLCIDRMPVKISFAS